MRAMIRHWVGGKLPEGYDDRQECDFTPEKIVKLFEQGYEVMLHHSYLREGKMKVPRTILYLDDKGRSFHQR